MSKSPPPLYVQPLNGAEEGPYTLLEATTAVRKHIYASQSAIEQMMEEHKKGQTGPWHFVYGFHDVTVRVGPELRQAI